nr:hypothetical protein [Tanacetum cinerariifolium]
MPNLLQVLVCGHCYAFAWRVYEGGLLLISVDEAVKDGIVSVTIAFGINNDIQDENLGHRLSIGPIVSASRSAFVPFATLLHGDSCRKGLNFRTLTKQARNEADNPDVNLMKEDVGNVLVWVKLCGVLVTAFSKDGLSALATKL